MGLSIEPIGRDIRHAPGIPRRVKGLVGSILSLLLLALLPVHAIGVRCYQDGALAIWHHPLDESVFYQPGPNGIAYNVQVIRRIGDYLSIFHSEPRRGVSGLTGDGIRAASQPGMAFSYAMPSPQPYVIWGERSPGGWLSLLYQGPDDAPWYSGGGNPMFVSTGGPYSYLFFVVVTDVDYSRSGWDARHVLAQARTLDGSSYEIWTEQGGIPDWRPFSDAVPAQWRSPRALQDANGWTVANNVPQPAADAFGLVGNIVKVDGVYRYFYTDCMPATDCQGQDTDGALYVRSSSGPGLQGSFTWSAPTLLIAGLPTRTLMRVAHARGMARWALLYSCYQAGSSRSDICLRYTTPSANPTDIAQFGAMDLYSGDPRAMLSPYYLDLQAGSGLRAQHFLLTDPSGNLTVPQQEDGDATRGGMVTWTDMQGSPYGRPVFRAGWHTVLGSCG